MTRITGARDVRRRRARDGAHSISREKHTRSGASQRERVRNKRLAEGHAQRAAERAQKKSEQAQALYAKNVTDGLDAAIHLDGNRVHFLVEKKTGRMYCWDTMGSYHGALDRHKLKLGDCIPGLLTKRVHRVRSILLHPIPTSDKTPESIAKARADALKFIQTLDPRRTGMHAEVAFTKSKKSRHLGLDYFTKEDLFPDIQAKVDTKNRDIIHPTLADYRALTK